MKINPVTIRSGCQLNSRRAPSQAKPSLYCRTQTNTKIMETSPKRTAANSATRNCLKFSIAIGSSAWSVSAAEEPEAASSLTQQLLRFLLTTSRGCGQAVTWLGWVELGVFTEEWEVRQKTTSTAPPAEGGHCLLLSSVVAKWSSVCYFKQNIKMSLTLAIRILYLRWYWMHWLLLRTKFSHFKPSKLL